MLIRDSRIKFINMATLNGVNGDIDGVRFKQSQSKAADVNNIATMTNGTHEEEEVTEDYSKALELLKTYDVKDGISIKDLMDETKTGGLTYNDFLLLPRYIGTSSYRMLSKTRL